MRSWDPAADQAIDELLRHQRIAVRPFEPVAQMEGPTKAVVAGFPLLRSYRDRPRPCRRRPPGPRTCRPEFSLRARRNSCAGRACPAKRRTRASSPSRPQPSWPRTPLATVAAPSNALPSPRASRLPMILLPVTRSHAFRAVGLVCFSAKLLQLGSKLYTGFKLTHGRRRRQDQS